MFTSRKLLVALVIVTLLLPGPQLSLAGNKSASVLPPSSNPQGKNYRDWTAEWTNFLVSMPNDQRPGFPNVGNHCAVKMDGHVGLLVTNPAATEPYSCTVAPGTMLFTPVAGIQCDTLSWPFPNNEDELRTCATSFAITHYQASIDGVEVEQLDKFFTLSSITTVTLPDNNLYGLPAGTTGQAIFYGPVFMIAPLSVGVHTLRLKAYFPDFDFQQDVTLLISVQP